MGDLRGEQFFSCLAAAQLCRSSMAKLSGATVTSQLETIGQDRLEKMLHPFYPEKMILLWKKPYGGEQCQ